MPRQLRHMHGKAGLVAMFLLWTSATCAHDGKILDSSVVKFTDEQLDKLEIIEPEIRDIVSKVKIKRITYLSDGLKVKGYLVVPREGRRLPCVIYNRGGNREFCALHDGRAAVMLGKIACLDCVVVASQYRGNAGGDRREQFGGEDVNDVMNLIPLLDAHPRADASGIGMYGWSRGGMMTYLALTRTNRLSTAIVGAGMTNAFAAIKERPEMETFVFAELVPNYAQKKQAELLARSAVKWPAKLFQRTPLLLLHGRADQSVHPNHSLSMASALFKTQHPFRFVFFEDGDHRLRKHRNEVDRLLKNWLDRYVRD